MKVSAYLYRRLPWLNLPLAVLLALLQRTPAARIFAGAGDYVLTSPAGQMLRAALTVATLGALHSRAGATQFVGPSSPVVGTVGTPLQVAFTYNGTPSAPARFEFNGTLPPGLAFIPAPNGSVITSGTPVIAGTPTQAGNYSISVQGYNAEGLTNNAQHAITFEISGGTAAAPAITTQPASQNVGAGQSATFTVGVSGTAGVQWFHNGTAISGATVTSLTINGVQPANAGLYSAVATNGAGTTTSQAAVLGLSSSTKLIGPGTEFPNIFHAGTGFTYDQILLEGPAASVRADPGQILRISFIDLNDDIVQVEFSGAGTLTLVLDGVTGPALPQKYNQAVSYMKGHAGIVLTGADVTTNLSVFSVGRINAANQALFQSETTYDGFADVAFIAITSPSGQFAGLRAANASLFATKGYTGLHAPDVQFAGPVFLSDINASDAAIPVFRIGSGGDVRVTGGDLSQSNGRAVQVSGITQLHFRDGSSSHGTLFSARTNQGQLEQNGVNVTAQIVVNP